MIEPTNWMSSLVVVKKPNGSIRICIDPTHLNKAIKRHHYPLACVEEIVTKLGEKRYSLYWMQKTVSGKCHWTEARAD